MGTVIFPPFVVEEQRACGPCAVPLKENGFEQMHQASQHHPPTQHLNAAPLGSHPTGGRLQNTEQRGQEVFPTETLALCLMALSLSQG